MTRIRPIDEGLELTTAALRLVAHVSGGPRLAWLSRPNGKNLLYWQPGRHRRGEWDFLGGHRLWTTRPGADECEETYRADNGACRWEIENNQSGFRVTAPVDPVTRLEREFQVHVEDVDRLRIDHFVRNVGPMLWSGGAWAVTATMPAPRYVVPLGQGTPWDTATLVLFDRWGEAQGGGGFADEQFRLARDALMLCPAGRENKRMVQAPAGIIAMHDEQADVLFAKQATYVQDGAYPRGANIALYTGGTENYYVELETMGPMVTLQPGESLHHVERWVLRAASNPALRTLFTDS